MDLPPGLVYLLRNLPYFAIPSAVTYASVKVLLHQTNISLSTLVVVLFSLLARPILFLCNIYYSEWADKRAAAAHGAVIAPKVDDPLLSIVSKMAESFRGGYPADIYLQWAKKYGNTYRFNLLNTKFISTLEPDHVKEQESSIQMHTGEMWKFHRAMSRPFFSRERISDFHIYDRNSTISLQMAKKRLSEGYSIDFQDLIARFTLDSAAEFLFGGSVESLSAGMPYPGQESSKNDASLHDHPASIFADSFMEGLHLTVMRIRMGDAWPLEELTGDKVLPFRKAMDVFIDPLMRKALDTREQELLNEKSHDENEEETFISHLVKHTQDPKVIKDELVNLLLAGRDTTMCLLSFAVYMLAEHPDIEKRLRDEIFEKVGAIESPNYDQMREMRYMRAFLNEVLRLYPPVPADSRISTKATVLTTKKSGDKPIYVPANTTYNTSVLYSVTNIHRREDLWGPDALKFDPDRFIDERLKKYFTPNPYIFCPFNAGPRICIGQQFAYHEATFYLVRLLQQFTEFSLDKSSNTPPPAEWASGDSLKATEKIFPMAHVTMYIKILLSFVEVDVMTPSLAPLTLNATSLYYIFQLEPRQGARYDSQANLALYFHYLPPMVIPPGPRYLFGLLPYFAKPSIIVYFALSLFQQHVYSGFPRWTIVVLSLLARPGLFVFDQYYSDWQNQRAAAANEANMAPRVPESSFSLISEFAESILTGHPGEAMLRWAQNYGNTVQFTFLNSTILSTVEPGHIKAFLATQFEAFEKGPVLFSQVESFFGTGVFNADGEMWKFHRAMTRPFFTRDRISHFELFARNCDMSLRTASERLSEGFSIDIQDLVSRFTLDSSTEFLFGGSVNSMLGGIPYPASASKKNPPEFYNHPSTIFVSAFNKGMVFTALRTIRGNQWPLSEFWRDEVTPMRKIMDEFTEPLMQAVLNKRESELAAGILDVKGDAEEETLLEHLAKNTQDTKILKDELINLLLAGRDTTMCLLTFSVYMLSRYPDVEKRLREEIYAKVGSSGNPSYDQIRELRYMRAFLNEVLRLYPPVPINFRTNNKPVLLPPTTPGEKPIYVPANTSCMYTVINLHRRTDLWGPDALEFDPDRFLDERLQKYFLPNPYIFCPFNAGPRICLGQQLAYNEASFYLVRLLQQFTEFTLDKSANIPAPDHWAVADGWKSREQIHPMSHLTMYVKGGLWVQMKEL
ncbi:hypothetical protein CVT25_015710 [Psilocybe cyanescens]|uniref:Cytochrome P450 n=1 Tax=Psilocybe cyanescens TaxID=93625 RepID=A0A409X1G6_PSICY|nr:hypothetical protein CVT25_015710 [Psilocybe cyanescens]